jgi:Fur family ferric uptake transcriptional regulator
MIASTQTNHPVAGETRAALDSASALQLATTRLKSAGLRITQPRLAILAALNRRATPSSIEQIHDDVGAANCDLVTVYRCMAVFEEIGVVRRAYFHNGTTLYELNLGLPTRYHVVCKGTNEVLELEPELTQELRNTIDSIEQKLRTRGFAKVGHLVEFFAANQNREANRTTPPQP